MIIVRPIKDVSAKEVGNIMNFDKDNLVFKSNNKYEVNRKIESQPPGPIRIIYYIGSIFFNETNFKKYFIEINEDRNRKLEYLLNESS